MNVLLERCACRSLAPACAALILVAGCSSSVAVPSAGAAFAEISAGAAGIVPNACSNPKILKVCVTPGGSAKLGVELTCMRGGKKVSCGKVTWSTKTSNAGLKGKFDPNPGNPSTETVSASKTIKKGHYSQNITARCTGVPNCVVHAKGAIWVI